MQVRHDELVGIRIWFFRERRDSPQCSSSRSRFCPTITLTTSDSNGRKRFLLNHVDEAHTPGLPAAPLYRRAIKLREREHGVYDPPRVPGTEVERLVPRRTWRPPGEPSKNVGGVTSAEYDSVATDALRAWLRYWERVAAGTVQRNARDEGMDAADESRRLRLEIDARER